MSDFLKFIGAMLFCFTAWIPFAIALGVSATRLVFGIIVLALMAFWALFCVTMLGVWVFGLRRSE